MQDPVCGMTVDPHHAAGTERYNGVTYAFCSPHCLETFRADPEQYVASCPRYLRRRTCDGHSLHLPHAPGGASGEAGCVPPLWDGP